MSTYKKAKKMQISLASSTLQMKWIWQNGMLWRNQWICWKHTVPCSRH